MKKNDNFNKSNSISKTLIYDEINEKVMINFS